MKGFRKDSCQSNTHEQERCPLIRNKGNEESVLEMQRLKANLEASPVLKDSDPLFGVLREDQVGVNPLTGIPRIAQEVLEGMRLYLLVANGP